MCLSGSHLVVGDTNFDLASRSCVYSIPVGKAAYQMAAALGGILGDQLVGGVVSGVVLAPVANTATTNNIAMATKQTLSPRWRVFARGLARHAPQADQVSLIISDTEAGEEWNVASGPTLEPPPDGPDARAVVARYDFAAQLPESIRRAIERAPAQTNGAPHDALRRHYVLKDNKSALEQAAERARAVLPLRLQRASRSNT